MIRDDFWLLAHHASFRHPKHIIYNFPPGLAIVILESIPYNQKKETHVSEPVEQINSNGKCRHRIIGLILVCFIFTFFSGGL